MAKRILVVTGGDTGPDLELVDRDAAYDLVIAADSGLDRARLLGLKPHVVVGDLDSASPDAVAWAREAGASVEEHPTHKHHTDLELSLHRALEEGPGVVELVGGSGGRPDHWLANLALLAAAAAPGRTVGAWMGTWRIDVVVAESPFVHTSEPGGLLSLVAIGGDARGVTTTGLIYPLSDEDLLWGSGRGISNVFAGGSVRVEVQSGTLLVMRPALTEGAVPK
ncbi:MAG: thiamine diphosphokinase [Actinobacteria bacterium]|nr:thiamine diphosphokinase [Actinomycetota bacterium]